MAREDQNSSVNIMGGLNTDSSLVLQPEGTTRFVLNHVNKTEVGDSQLLAIEESNKPCYEIPAGNIPVGKVYVGNEEHVIFLVDTNGNSSIALVNKLCDLQILVTDKDQEEKFNFSLTNQIDATFRLRRGCERTIYWVDPKPRNFVLEKPEDFKTEDGSKWDIDKFSLSKKYQTIPFVESLKAIDNAGNLPPGSYNLAIRYLDENFNPTEFVITTETISIYGKFLSSTYRDIRGETKETKEYYKYEDTNKAIRIKFKEGTLDTSYPFYQIGVIEANSGSGNISAVKYSAPLSTYNLSFTYTGNNYESVGSKEEVSLFDSHIEEAQHIEQIENRLLLGEITGKKINYCNLQKYASKIGTDLIIKDTILSQISTSNSKDPSMHFEGIGGQPGEIYSLGIVYIFEDNSVSPALHIPGKAFGVSPEKIYSPGEKVYPMANVKNRCTDTMYIDANSCNELDFWGVDIEGNQLKDTAVRHHRFSLRTDFNIPFVEKTTEAESNAFTKKIKIVATSTNLNKGPEVANQFSMPTTCLPEGVAGYDETCVETFYPPFVLKIGYIKNGVADHITITIDPSKWEIGVDEPLPTKIEDILMSQTIIGTNITLDTANIFEIIDVDGVTTENPLSGTTTPSEFTTSISVKGIVYKISLVESLDINKEELYKAPIFGWKFSNITLPSLEDTGGHKVIGYYIVKQERTEDEKTILDSGVLTSTLINKNFVSHGLLYPSFIDPNNTSKVKKDIVSIIHPEHKFKGNKYNSLSSIIQQGTFGAQETIKSRVKINDVMEGSSYVSGKHKNGENDPDGWSLQIKTRDTRTNFVPKKNFTLLSSDIKDMFYLNALEDNTVQDSAEKFCEVYNLACDNKIGIISLNQNFTEPITTSLPYVYLQKDNLEPYANFRLHPYYKASQNPVYFLDKEISTTEVFNGDSYICPMRYVSSVFYDNRIRQRAGKTSAWNYIVSGLLVVAALATTVFTFGAAAPLLVGSVAVAVASTALGISAALIMSGLKQDTWVKAYNNKYDEGLRETIEDEYLKNDFDPVTQQSRGFFKNPPDDEVQWLGDCANLWFESAINISLRHGATNSTPDFLNAPGKYELGTQDQEQNKEYFGIDSVWSTTIKPTTALDYHMVDKLTIPDTEKKDGKSYLGIASSEIYLVNPDYHRRNKEKMYSPLGIEYDCCSDCNEYFPHRWQWSEQSFQEELTDNFKTFLPNNYKDIEGETGKITDIFRIQNNIYIHTEEALWHCPQTFQERVTGDIISFIGTGEYFSIPPRKIVDDNNSSAGNRHKWGRTKTKHGVLFPSYKERKWYLFNGQSLMPISDSGMIDYFKQSTPFTYALDYFNSNKQEYAHFNNPSNPIGLGFISTYDTEKERFLITKKDFKIPQSVGNDYLLCMSNGTPKIILGAQAFINQKISEGWTYTGIMDCKLTFSKTTKVIKRKDCISYIYHPEEITETVIPGCTPYIKSATIGVYGNNNTGGTLTFTCGYDDCENKGVILGSGSVGYQNVTSVTLENFCGTPFIDGDANFGEWEIITDDTKNCDKITTVITPAYTEEIIGPCSYTEEVIETLSENLPTLDFETTKIDTSWTMSYSLETKQWVSWHSYFPNFYFHDQERFYGWYSKVPGHIYKFNVRGHYRTFFGKTFPAIIEWADNPNPISTKYWDYLIFQSEARKWDPITQEHYDIENTTYNKVLLYNTHQISGILEMVPKNNEEQNYLLEQTKNNVSSLQKILIDRNERDWSMNDMRDYRIGYTLPMFIKDPAQIQTDYFIDKIVNPLSIDFNKDWQDIQNFRDKFLVVRLIFDSFVDTRLIFHFSASDKKVSER